LLAVKDRRVPASSDVLVILEPRAKPIMRRNIGHIDLGVILVPLSGNGTADRARVMSVQR
jgi:hypothetical protein